MQKFSFDETVEYFNQCGFLVLDDYIEDIHIGDKLNVEDIDGYRYWVSRHLLSGKVTIDEYGNKKHVLQKYAIQNPYSIDNIILWMNRNNCNFKFHHGEYKGNDTPSIFLECLGSGHIWNTQWTLIQRGQGCPYCASKRVSFGNSLADVRPDLIKEWDFKKNKLVPEEVMPRSQKKFWWVCSVCGYGWNASASNRNAKDPHKSTNCPKCDRSTGELEVEKILDMYSIRYITEYAFAECKYKKRLFFDFFLPDYACCIEYNGQQHYRPTITRKKMIPLGIAKSIKRCSDER